MTPKLIPTFPKPHAPRLLLYAAVFGLCSSPFFLPSALKAAWLGLAFAYGLRWLTPWQDGQGWDLERVATKRALALGLKVGLLAAIPILVFDLILWLLEPAWIGNVVVMTDAFEHLLIRPNPLISALVTPVYAIGFYVAYARNFRPAASQSFFSLSPSGILCATAYLATALRLAMIFPWPLHFDASVLLGVLFALALPVPLFSLFLAGPFVLLWNATVRNTDPTVSEWQESVPEQRGTRDPHVRRISWPDWILCGLLVVVGVTAAFFSTISHLKTEGRFERNKCQYKLMNMSNVLSKKLSAGEATPADLSALTEMNASQWQGLQAQLHARRITEEAWWECLAICPGVVKEHPRGEAPIPYLYLLRGVPAADIVSHEQTVVAFDSYPGHGRRRSPTYMVLRTAKNSTSGPIIQEWHEAELLQALDAMADPKVLKGCTRRTEGEKIVYDFTNGTTSWSLVFSGHRFRLYDAAGKEISGE